MTHRISGLFAALALFGVLSVTPSFAQDKMGKMPAKGKMTHSKMAHGKMARKSKMSRKSKMAHSKMAHGKMTHDKMKK